MTLETLPDDFSSAGYEFRRARRDDRPAIDKWLASKHLEDWWTPGGEELGAALAGDAERRAYLVHYQGWPFAYVQLADAAFDPALADALALPKGTVRIDQFVGDTEMIGFGHGVKFIKAFVAAMKEMPSIAQLVAAPRRDNIFAVRAYSQAGMKIQTVIDTIDGELTLLSLPLR